MASLGTNILEKFPTLRKHRSKLEYGLVSLLTAGGERIFSTAIFQCPCNPTWNLPYGMVFLLVPALGLFLLGYVLNTRTWRLTTGCCRCDHSQMERHDSQEETQDSQMERHDSQEETQDSKMERQTQICKEFLWISATAVVAPLTWVAVGLLGGTFYECSASGIAYLARRICLDRKDNCSTLMHKLPCLKEPEPDQKDLLNTLRAHSQVAGWILIAVVILILMIVTSINYCRSPVSFMKLKFRNIYVIEEKKSLAIKFKDNAAALADENVKCFFEGSSPHHKTPDDKEWEQISLPYNFYLNKQYYSMLHKHVNTRKNKKASTDSVAEAQV